MQQAPEVTFHGFHPGAQARRIILERVDQLERFHEGIVGCRTVVERPHHRRRKGDSFRVQVHVALPGEDVHINRDPDPEGRHEALLLAIHDSFDTAERLLKQKAERRRHEVKTHPDPPRGRVVKLFDQSGYGFVQTAEGRELYFHRNAVGAPGFEALAIGDPVRFVESRGDEGPQASFVRRLARR